LSTTVTTIGYPIYEWHPQHKKSSRTKHFTDATNWNASLSTLSIIYNSGWKRRGTYVLHVQKLFPFNYIFLV